MARLAIGHHASYPYRFFDFKAVCYENGSFFILIVGPPKIKSFRSWEVVEGRKVTLRCKPDMTVPTEQVTFYVNGVSLRDRPKSKYIPSCQKLIIREVKFPDDNVVITCKLENKYGYSMKNATVSVLGKYNCLEFYFIITK